MEPLTYNYLIMFFFFANSYQGLEIDVIHFIKCKFSFVSIKSQNVNAWRSFDTINEQT